MRDYKGRSSNLYLRDRRRSSPRGLIWGLIALLIAGLAVGAWFLLADDPALDADPAAALPSQATVEPTQPATGATPPRPANIIPLRLPPPRETTPPDAQPAGQPTTEAAEAEAEPAAD